MNVIEISSRRFRDKQVITPVNVEELYFSPEMERRIDHAIQSIEEGKGETYTADQIDQLLGL